MSSTVQALVYDSFTNLCAKVALHLNQIQVTWSLKPSTGSKA